MARKMSGHGGKRKGAGRPKSAPTVVHRLSVDKQLMGKLKESYTTREINAKLSALLVELAKPI